MLRLGYVLLALALTLPARAQWTQLGGPVPPRVGGLAEAGGVLVLGTDESDSGDVYRSTDGGHTWANVGLPNGGVLAAHPAGSSFFLGTYLSGAFRSDDGGQTWIALPQLGASVGSFAGTPARLFAGGDGFLAGLGVWRSLDGGLSWTEVIGAFSSHALYAEGLLVLAGGSGEAGLYRSTDGGDTWAPAAAFGGSGWSVDSFTAEGGWLYAGVRFSGDPARHGVYRSADDGLTWTKVSANLIALRIQHLAVLDATLFAVIRTSTGVSSFWRSTDGGVTWALVPPPYPNGEGAWTLFDDGEGLWLGSTYGAFRSTDGQVWDPMDAGTAAIRGVASLFVDDERLFVGLTTNGGTGEGLWSTDTGAPGAAWVHHVGLGDRADVQDLVRMDDVLIAASTSPRGVFRSLDGGASWAGPAPGTGPGVLLADLAEHNGALYAGAHQTVYRSDDQGASWKPLVGVTEVFAVASYDGLLFAGTNGAGVFLSEDGGQTWAEANTGLPSGHARHVAAFETHNGRLFAATAGGLRVWDGSGWGPLGPGVLFINAAASVNGVLVVGSALDEHLYLSVDGGATWTPFAEGYTGGEVYAIAATETDLVVGSRGHGVWVRPLSDLPTTTAGAPSWPGTSEPSVSVGPNPVRVGQPIVVRFALDAPGTVQLAVFDGLGRLVRSQPSGPSADALSVSTDGLAPGLYFVRLSTPSGAHAARFAVLR